MAKKTKKATKDAGGGAEGSLSNESVVEILQRADNHLKWLFWLGACLDLNAIITLARRPTTEPPPSIPGCGFALAELRVRDLVGLVDTTECDVAHAISRLGGLAPAPHGRPGLARPKLSRPPVQRRARR
jgi:hypothetical protein